MGRTTVVRSSLRAWPLAFAACPIWVATIAGPAAASDASSSAPKPHYVRKDAEHRGMYWYTQSTLDDPPKLLALIYLGRDVEGRHVFRPLWLNGMHYRCAVPCRQVEFYQPDRDIVRRTIDVDRRFFHAHIFEDAERGMLEAERSVR